MKRRIVLFFFKLVAGQRRVSVGYPEMSQIALNGLRKSELFANTVIVKIKLKVFCNLKSSIKKAAGFKSSNEAAGDQQLVVNTKS